MPWTTADVERHNKGLSPAQKAKWVSIANGVLEADGDEAKAIRVANARVREAEPDMDFSMRSEMEREKERLREADDDHPYGPWGGGSKAAGGRPMGGGGGSGGAQADPTVPRDRWASHDEIVKEMSEKYPGSDWNDLHKLSLSDANDAADTIDGLSTRFGEPPAFAGIRVRGERGGVLAEVKRPDPNVKGSAVYVYGMDKWGNKGSHGGKSEHFVGSASSSLRQSKRSTITHEMGHMYLGMNLHSRFGANRHDPVRQQTEKFVGKRLPKYSKSRVSVYGRTNPHENWAELFTAAASPSLGSKNKSSAVAELRGILDNDFPIQIGESAVGIAEEGSSLTTPHERMDLIAATAAFGHVCGFAAAHPSLPLEIVPDEI